VVMNGFNEKETPTSITFIGDLFEEAKALRIAKALQDATDFHHQHPPDERLAVFLGRRSRDRNP
jgi:Asp-tRNA(Asn)/Glu-tRNA(Gln) amidotransferase A subunit family amidase